MTDGGPTEAYWRHLADGRFMLQRSSSTGRYVFYPRVLVPGSGEQDLEWVEASGRGTVYSTTTVRRAVDRGGDFNISLVELAEGPRMLARVLGIAPTAVHIGLPVVARIELPPWRPAETARPTVVFYPAE